MTAAAAVTACRAESRGPDALTPPLKVVEWGAQQPTGPTAPTVPTIPTAGAPEPGRTGCPIRLTDSEGATSLLLLSSQTRTEGSSSGGVQITKTRSVGDYAVQPAGRFGVGPGKLLRVNCVSMVGVAVVDSARK